jgi:hypothetical protein
VIDRVINRKPCFIGIAIGLPDRLMARLLPRKIIGVAMLPQEGRNFLMTGIHLLFCGARTFPRWKAGIIQRIHPRQTPSQKMSSIEQEMRSAPRLAG